MIRSSEKRVCPRIERYPTDYAGLTAAVCVSTLMVEEIKRIIKDSEITK